MSSQKARENKTGKKAEENEKILIHGLLRGLKGICHAANARWMWVHGSWDKEKTLLFRSQLI